MRNSTSTRCFIRFCAVCLALFAALWPALPAGAHALPVSYLDVKLDNKGASATLETSVKDWLREAPSLDGHALLGAQASAQGARLLKLLESRLQLQGDGQTLRAQLRRVEALPERGDVRLRLRYDWRGATEPHTLGMRCQLFPRDPEHKTLLALYRGDALARQDIFDRNTPHLALSLAKSAAEKPNVMAVVQRFVREGVHHIFIGPDHILFIVGLLLLGGTLGKLLKIVTAFTVAHSLTLALATLGVLNPSPRLIEPLIALSIVFVGVHDVRLLRAGAEEPAPKRGGPDARLLFAFVFGLVHGFGFAGVLRELELPRAALFASLGAFNVGVEIGQMCIVLAVAPLLALLHRRSHPLALRVALASSLVVIAAGAFWLVQRVAFA